MKAPYPVWAYSLCHGRYGAIGSHHDESGHLVWAGDGTTRGQARRSVTDEFDADFTDPRVRKVWVTADNPDAPIYWHETREGADPAWLVQWPL